MAKKLGIARSGVHPLVVALLVVGLIIAGTWGYLRHSAVQEREVDLAKVTAERDDWKTREALSHAALVEVVPWFVGKGEPLDQLILATQGPVESLLTPLALERKREIMDTLRRYYYPNLPEGDALPAGQDWREQLREGKRWVLDIVADQQRRIETLQSELEEVKRHRERIQAEHDDQVQQLEHQRDNILQTNASTVSDLQRQHQSAIAERDRYQEQVGQLDGRVRELEQQIRRVQEVGRTQVNSLQEDLAQVQRALDEVSRLGEITTRPWEETGVDAEILRVVPEQELVYLNIGHEQRVRRGMRFAAFRREKGGMPLWKGTVEVVRMEDHICEARILVDEADEFQDAGGVIRRRSYDRRDPILEGDFVANPIFQVGTTPRFVLTGLLDTHTREEAAFLIENDGGEVMDEVDVQTTFVVTGEEPDQALYGELYEHYMRSMELAKTLKCEIITERQFLRYLRNYRASTE